jgi:hypothetical protein
MAAGRIWRGLQIVIAVGGLVIGLMIWLGTREMMGTRLTIIGENAVNYSGSATEQEARSLGESLKEIGYFKGDRAVDVLLRKDGKEGIIVSFVVTGNAWNDAEMVENFRIVGEAIAPSVGGAPIKVRLIDEKLNTQKEILVGATAASTAAA